MAKSFACKDIGMECKFQTRANSEEELMKKIGDHARKAHNITQVDAALAGKIKAAIKEV